MSAGGVVTDVGSPSAAADMEQRGRLHVADRVIERIATHAAVQIDGVTRTGSGLDKVVGLDLPRADSTVAGDQVRLSIDIAIGWPHGAGEVARSVRHEVTRQVGNLTGLNVAAVHVNVARFASSEGSTARRVE